MVKTLTYSDLRRTLTRLGFEEHSVPGGIVFWEDQTQTRLTLPEMPLDAPLEARHLSVARAIVVSSGLAGSDDFERALEQAA